MLIEYKSVNVNQTDGKDILSAVDFTVNEGEFIYLIGRVGTGKSSLLKTMYFELDVENAEKALVFNCDITTLKRKHVPALRRQMGIIFQDFQLLSDRSVRKNLEFVLKATGWKKKTEIENRIKEVLAEDTGTSSESQVAVFSHVVVESHSWREHYRIARPLARVELFAVEVEVGHRGILIAVVCIHRHVHSHSKQHAETWVELPLVLCVGREAVVGHVGEGAVFAGERPAHGKRHWSFLLQEVIV